MSIEPKGSYPEELFTLPEKYTVKEGLEDAEAMFDRIDTLLTLLYHDGQDGAHANNFNLSERQLINAISQCMTWARMGNTAVIRAQREAANES